MGDVIYGLPPSVGLPLYSEGYLQSEKIFGPKIQVFFLQFSRIMHVFDTLLFFMLIYFFKVPMPLYFKFQTFLMMTQIDI